MRTLAPIEEGEKLTYGKEIYLIDYEVAVWKVAVKVSDIAAPALVGF